MIIKTLPTRSAFSTFVLGVLGVFMLASTATAQSSSVKFPYQALVSKDNTLVRSGPGKVHYGTQKLAAGQVVEVYRHDPDGWCAIRPVEGSFCIIPESTVEIIGEGVGEIKLAGTTPFVGTKLGSVEKPLWQVKLREKEKVALIGQLSWPNPEGHSTIWYQIKPPAGEFRWINVSNLESLLGETMASIIAPKSNLASPKPPTVAAIPKSATVAATTVTATSATVVPTKPNVDLATAGRPPIQRPATNSIPSSLPQQPLAQPLPPTRNDFAAEPSSVQLASFGSSGAPIPAPSRLPEPAAPAAQPTLPPLQDSGSGWRRATRSIPSDGSYKSAAANFNSNSIPRDTRHPNDSPSSYNNQYSNSGFTTQQQYSTNAAPSNTNQAYQPYDLNSSRHSQQSYSGQIRVADASPDRSRFAQQLNRSGANQSGAIGNTFTGQPNSTNALQTLNNRLTVEMLKAPSQWQLAPLEAATRQYMTTANYTQQQAAQQFLTKLANCRQVAAGYSNGNGSSIVNTNSGLPNDQFNTATNFGAGRGSALVGSAGNRNNFTSNAQFDATGWLNELKQGRGTEPSTYVLQDETGKIIYHVTPIPGINLNRYLKKRIGVNGQLGFNQRLNLKHVTIERVFPL